MSQPNDSFYAASGGALVGLTGVWFVESSTEATRSGWDNSELFTITGPQIAGFTVYSRSNLEGGLYAFELRVFQLVGGNPATVDFLIQQGPSGGFPVVGLAFAGISGGTIDEIVAPVIQGSAISLTLRNAVALNDNFVGVLRSKRISRY